MIGVVLAGGLSSRMRSDKAALIRSETSTRAQTMLDFSIELLQKAGCNKVEISGQRWGGVADEFTSLGPLSGIYSVIKKYGAECFVVIPVDMPLLNSSLLIQLIDALKECNAVHFKDSQFPLVFKSTDTLIQTLQRILIDPEADRSIKNILHFMNAQTVICDNPSLLSNTNTPHEWAEVQPLIQQNESY